MAIVANTVENQFLSKAAKAGDYLVKLAPAAAVGLNLGNEIGTYISGSKGGAIGSLVGGVLGFASGIFLNYLDVNGSNATKTKVKKIKTALVPGAILSLNINKISTAVSKVVHSYPTQLLFGMASASVLIGSAAAIGAWRHQSSAPIATSSIIVPQGDQTSSSSSSGTSEV